MVRHGRETTHRNARRWSQDVAEPGNALTLDPRIFTWSDPSRIAGSLKRSALRSRRRKSTPFRSAMSMLNFYINRAGRSLNAAQRAVLERAKTELRRQFHKGPTRARAIQ